MDCGPVQPRQKFKNLFKKITKTKSVGGMVQVVEHLPTKHKALNSNPSSTKKKNKNIYLIELL
jgi:hypothetical protein